MKAQGDKVLCAVVLFISLAVCSVYSFAQSFDGFRNLKWGSPPEKDMIKGSSWGDEAIYRRPSDALGISAGGLGVELAAIEYSYNKNRLHLVQLYPALTSRADWATLSHILNTRFGDPLEAEEIIDGIFFITKTYDKDPFTHVRLWFKVYGTQNRIICTLHSKKMRDIIIHEEGRARSKIKGGF